MNFRIGDISLVRGVCVELIAAGLVWSFFSPLAGAESFVGGPLSDVPNLDLGGPNIAPAVPISPTYNVSSPLNFSFTQGADLIALQGTNPTLAANVVAGFNAAADLWREAFVDPITINLTIDYEPLGAGILGSTGSQTAGASYSNTRTALIADKKSANDTAATAAASLPSVTARTFFTNDRAGAKFLDSDGSANNVVLDVSRANLKALGLVAANDAASDGDITFSSNFSWDFDRSNGITAGQFDFVGVAAHEIGHLMGFVSGVDIVDFYSGAGGNASTDLNGGAAGIGTLDPFRIFSVLDLYRYSSTAVTQGPGVLDWAVGGTPYFSLDGGTTNLGLFSTGSSNGDGRQASHWKDNASLGIMDPTLASGELAIIRPLDLQAFDVIGYDAVPEPGTAALFSLGLLAVSLRRRRSAAGGC